MPSARDRNSLKIRGCGFFKHDVHCLNKLVCDNSGRKAWWICQEGHEWQAEILSRNKGAGCPKCAMVAWNGGDPKIDIRSWSPDHRKMTRGITLTEEQGEKLVKSLGQRMLDKQKTRIERDPYER